MESGADDPPPPGPRARRGGYLILAALFGRRGRRPRIVKLARFNHRHQAEIARGYLEDAGIPAALSADDGGGAFGMPIATGGGGFPTLFVREDQLERAREILAETGMMEGEEGRGSGG